MTIIKASSLKPEKSILEKKLLADNLEAGEPDTEVRVTVTHLQHVQQKKRCCFNFFLILLAMMVLAAGIVSGIYLYKHLSRKIHTGKIQFSVDQPHAEPEKSSQKDSGMMEPYVPNTDKPRNRHPFQSDFLDHRINWEPVKIEQDVEVDEKTYEKIHMPKFGIFRETLVLHDFTKNYSGIVDFDEKACYVMRLDRDKVTPPRNWLDLLRKFQSGYYMPKASVLKREYRVVGGPITDVSQYGLYIENECKNFNTYWLEKKVGDGLIEKRSAEQFKRYASFNGMETLLEYAVYQD